MSNRPAPFDPMAAFDLRRSGVRWLHVAIGGMAATLLGALVLLHHDSVTLSKPVLGALLAGLGGVAMAALVSVLRTLLRSRVEALRLALRMSRRLARNTDRFRALTKEAADCTLICDTDTTIRYANPALKALLGYRPVQLIGQRLETLLAAADRARLRSALASSGEADVPAAPLLLTLRHADGSWRWIEATLRDLRARPAVAGIVLNCLDVSEREHARRELDRVAQRLEVALEASQVALWDLDLASGAVHLSAQWAQLLDEPPGDTATNLDQLAQRVHPDDLPALRQALRHVLRGETEVYRIDHRVRSVDGRWRWIESVGRVVARDGDGRALRLAGVNSDISQRKESEVQIADLAYHDALTDLPNRALLDDRLTQAIGQAARHGESLAVLLLDIHRFVQINEAFGYAAGDAVLCTLADRLRQPLSHGETLARVGGDKFAIALPGRGGGDAASAAAQLLLQALVAPLKVGDASVEIGASVGIALFPADGHDASSLLRGAEIALAEAKAAGPGQVHFCDPLLSARARRRVALERELRAALDQGALTLAFQPLCDAASGRILGAEALVRWIHPQHGEIAPAEFIPIAEDSGLIVTLGQWVLNQACLQAQRWQATLAPGFRIAVNLSLCQLKQRDLVGSVLAALASSGLAHGTLELEITESQWMAGDNATLDILQRLKREAGVRLAIDDFGTGYSSFASLRRLPVDKLKIDRSFVHGVASDPTDAALVAGMLSMAAALWLDVTVEGVETPAQLARLQALGATLVQGYLVGRPMSAAALTRRLSARQPLPV
jgi:diguanylate cyclase (GGDEF)-like protein/PAS domain S-box-containing protein